MRLSRQKRDVTRSLAIVAEVKAVNYGTKKLPVDTVALLLDELHQILTDMDARTGRRDPTKRPAKQ